MAQIHEAWNEQKDTYQEIRYTPFARFLHSPRGNRLCLILAAVCLPLFLFFLCNPQIPLALRDKIPMFFANILTALLQMGKGTFFKSLTTLAVSVGILYFFLRSYFSDFVSFLLHLLVLPLELVVLFTFSQSLVHISAYAFPVLLGIIAISICCETRFNLCIVTPYTEEGWVRKAGVEGEERALNAMRGLGDHCHIYTNLVIPYQGKTSEADMVFVTPSGVTIVEVKNFAGTLSGNICDKNLIHNDEETYNPAAQVETHRWRMSGYLREQGIRIPVQRCVFFVNPKLRLHLQSTQDASQACPVFTARDKKALSAYVDGDPRCPEAALSRTLHALDALVAASYRRKHTQNSGETGKEHGYEAGNV